MSVNPDLNFTYLSDDNSNLEFTSFRPNTLLNFDEIWQPTTNLEFDKSAIVSNDVNLAIAATVIISASGSASIADADPSIAISGTITPIASGIMTSDEAVTGIVISAVYNLNAIASGAASYDSNVDRFVYHDVSSDFQQSKLTGIDKQGKFESNKKLTNELSVDWQQSKLIGTDSQAAFEANEQLQTSSQQLFEQSKLIGTSSKQLAEYQLFMAHSKRFDYEQAKIIGQDNWFGFEAMAKRQIEQQLKAERARLIGFSKLYDNRSASVLAKDYEIPKEFAKLMYSAWSERFIVVPDIEPEPIDPVLLDFVCKWFKPDTTLRFGAICQQEPDKPITSAGVIFVTNSVSLARSDDGREIKMLGFSVGIDSNSYTWSFSATVPLSELSKVNTAIEQRIGVEFTCNGNLWRFILDSCDDSISFGESSLTIKGKSRAMLLAHPYAQQRGFKFDTAMSARQIADAELNRDGVPSGFTLDWQLAGVNGWNVPANTYSYTGKTPINSLQWIAEAAGGFINADMSADVLHVLAHYPIPSWEWAAQTPSINLTKSLITSRSRGRVNKPAYNGVLLYGEHDTSFGGLIKRTGTSGGYQPPMVTSDLMTDTAAAISRGKMILSDTGDIGNIGISMPLVADIGVLKPSTLIGVNDGESWVGMVRGTTITGRLSSNRALEIDQSIDVERHFDKEIV